MYVPEWEVEESIIWNPDLIEVPSRLENLKLVERQRYLKNLGRYIDILFKNKDKYVIVEVKCNHIDQTSVVTDQVLEYRKGLSKELRIPEEKIICILATPEGFSEDVKGLCKHNKILTVEIDENEIINIIPKIKNSSRFTILSGVRKALFKKILEKRGVFINPDEIDNLNEKILDKINSVRTWTKHGLHDGTGKEKLAKLFKEISKNAPICAHDVGIGNNSKLTTNLEMWFWLFYSVMDRRSNAANFITARRALEGSGLFQPYKIVKLVNKKNKAIAILTITEILERSRFPLMYDSYEGKEAQPRSIVEAAMFINKYNFNFDNLIDHHLKENNGDSEATYKSLRKDIQTNIYGVGPRIASQFIRGMVLKGNWNLPLKDDLLLEKCRFNVRFAGKLRLGLVEIEDSYYKDLGEFADTYLDGNRAIISHVLWYIRKRYCDKKITCNQCKLSGFCKHYPKVILEPSIKAETTLESFY